VPGLGATDERIIAHDADARTLSYTVIGAEKIPSFVQNMTNNWTRTPTGDSTRIAMRLTADIGGPLAPIMKPMVRRQFNKNLAGIWGGLTSARMPRPVSPVSAHGH
jgi:hypothetical protein